MPDQELGEEETETRVRRARNEVLVLAAALTGISASVLTLTPGRTDALVASGSITMVLIAIGFFVSEPMVFHIEARNESVSFSPTDLPLAYGLLFLSPVSLVLMRLVVGGAALVIWRRPPAFKLALNLSNYAVETVVAVVVLRALHPGDLAITPQTWATLTAALLVSLIASAGTIALAISRFENDLVDRLRSERLYSFLFYLPMAVVVATAAVPVIDNPWFAAVSSSPVVVIWLVLRSHGSLMHRYSDLSDVHDFSHQVGRSEHLDDITSTAIQEVTEHLRASRAALLVWDDRPGSVAAAAGDTELLSIMPTDSADRDWAAVASPDRIEVVRADPPDEEVARRLAGIDVAEAVVAPLADEAGPVGLLVVADRHGASTTFSIEDVSRVRTIARQLTVALRKGRLYVRVQHQATHDRLTGLPNRTLFEAHADAELIEHRQLAIFLLDLDRFKQVNDTLGHQAGDELLVKVAARLRTAVGNDGLIARLGGDEFGFVAAGCDGAQAVELARRMAHVINEPFPVQGADVSVGVSVGIALGPDHGDDLTTLLRRADVAMYAAKRHHDEVRVFEALLEDPQDADRLALLGDLRAAIRQGALDVHYQPQLDVRSGQIVGAEALARWIHPEHGFVPPDEFIVLAEQSGLILPLTDRVLTRALGTASRWRSDGHEVGVAVNISAHSLIDDQFPDLVVERLREHDLPGEALTLEITETAMMSDTERAFQTLTRLGEFGIHVSIDDFGTGYSSLVNLRRLPITELKIDRAFVMAMLEDECDAAIVRSTIELGHSLGLPIVAEGVESTELLGHLGMLGCDIAQGYVISRPLPAAELFEYLDSSRRQGSAVLSG
ncbi:MAG: EAL domain-containing protein [Actinomycetota bacterium]